jgi:chemotaxis methyl-accepting protein methylase
MKFEHLFFEGVAPVGPTLATPPERRRFASVSLPLSTEAESFFELLLGRADLPARAYRSRALARRLPACLRFLRVTTAGEAARKIAAEPELAAAALNVVLLGVTEFFRDRPVFEKLRQTVLPELLARHGRLRVWSAACSEGQELYSVAMLLAEAGRLGDCELLGTDCRSEAIEQARSGVFAREALEEALEEMGGTRYFTLSRLSAAIDATLRLQTRWRVADVLAHAERGPWQLILWRNMAIYLESDAAEDVWLRLCTELAPGGYLIAGKADHLPKWLPLERVTSCIYRKVKN